MTTIYIIRHGKTDFNEQSRYLGSIDIPLNSTGKEQAIKVRNYFNDLRDRDIDIIISSPLKRAIETAKIIKPDNLKIVPDPAFMERNIGVYEGLTKDEAKEKYPRLFTKNITRIFNEAPTGGETILEVQDRVFAGLNKIKEIYQEKNILIITHAFVAKVINKYFNPQISEQDFFNFVLQNAEIKKYKF
ncbi:MAG TPA: histidine phosphatase family protein [Candidatus Portnoybacteria bacterium]|nr:histidine phosphatase family protein [Candidatus Portnoybacteria bacterium]